VNYLVFSFLCLEQFAAQEHLHDACRLSTQMNNTTSHSNFLPSANGNRTTAISYLAMKCGSSNNDLLFHEQLRLISSSYPRTSTIYQKKGSLEWLLNQAHIDDVALLNIAWLVWDS
jgi:hypothetical protein